MSTIPTSRGQENGVKRVFVELKRSDVFEISAYMSSTPRGLPEEASVDLSK